MTEYERIIRYERVVEYRPVVEEKPCGAKYFLMKPVILEGPVTRQQYEQGLRYAPKPLSEEQLRKWLPAITPESTQISMEAGLATEIYKNPKASVVETNMEKQPNILENRNIVWHEEALSGELLNDVMRQVPGWVKDGTKHAARSIEDAAKQLARSAVVFFAENIIK